jgi:hypothetical protein
MNFSVHLPQSLLIDLDRFVKTDKLSHNSADLSGVLGFAMEDWQV